MPVFKENGSTPEKLSPNLDRRIINLDDLMVVVCDFSGGPAAEPDSSTLSSS